MFDQTENATNNDDTPTHTGAGGRVLVRTLVTISNTWKAKEKFCLAIDYLMTACLIHLTFQSTAYVTNSTRLDDAVDLLHSFCERLAP